MCSSSLDGIQRVQEFGAVGGSPAEVVRKKAAEATARRLWNRVSHLLIALQRRELVHPSQTIKFAPQHVPVIV